MIIKNGLVFSKNMKFESLTVTTKEDYILSVNPQIAYSEAEEVFDATDCYVIPGLTDIHFHGCDCHDFCDATMEAYEAIAKYEFSQGVTSMCPATMTLSEETLCNILKTAADYKNSRQAKDLNKPVSELVGIHMEGPFISEAKKGAQNSAYIQKPTAEKVRKWLEASEGLVRLMSIAPENEGAIECITECHENIRFSIAHTQSDYDTAVKAFDAGADHVTHLYNAMPPFTHRAPGVIGAAADRDAYVELICDGVHIDPSVVRATFKLFGDHRVILISDSMEATGKPDGIYSLGGLEVHVNGNHATLADGTLAGSVTPLIGCLRTAVKMGIPLESAVRAATINPCRSIGIDHIYGSIEAGKKAHFLILDKSDLSIKAIIKGQMCF